MGSLSRFTTRGEFRSRFHSLTRIRNLSYFSIKSVRGEFEWSEETKTMVLGAFFYGYLSSQIPGGIMATKLSVKWVFGYGIFLTSVLSVATEWVARWNVNAFIALRVLEGVTEVCGILDSPSIPLRIDPHRISGKIRFKLAYHISNDLVLSEALFFRV